MRCELIRPQELGQAASYDAAVVTDVFRATSSVCALLNRGAAEVLLIPDLACFEAAGLGEMSDLLIVSELKDAASYGPSIDNSPAKIQSMQLSDARPMLVTTNGTKALAVAHARASSVYALSFMNLFAVAEHIQRSGFERIAVVPAGRFDSGEARAEDDACAHAFIAHVSGAAVDWAKTFQAVRSDALCVRRIQRRAAFGRDVDVALSVEQCGHVPRLSRQNEHLFCLRPAR